MDTNQIIRLLWRTLGKRGVRQAAQRVVTGNKTETQQDRVRARQVNQTMRRTSQAVRLFRRFTKM